MTRDEAKQFLMIMQTAYPTYKPPDKTTAVNLWAAMFSEYDYQTVVVALQAYIAADEKGFAPSIGQVMAKIRMLSAPDKLAPMEAWSMVSKALRNGSYHAQEEFEALPEDVQRAVGSASMLHAWALDENFNEAVVMSQFLRSYQTITARREEQEKLPAHIRNMIEDTINRLEG